MKIKKDTIIELIEIIIGNAILAIGFGIFLIPANILGGGLGGLSIALAPIIPVDPTLFVTVATWFLFFVGLIFLGKKFSLTTLLSSILFPLLLSLCIQFGPKFDVANDILFSFYGGICVGIGVGLVFRAGSSTGGLDIPPVILHRYFGVPLNLSAIVIDATIVLLGLFTRGPYDTLIGLIAVFSMGYTLQKTMLFGATPSLEVNIISDNALEIEKAIIKELDRGVTRIKAQGAYHEVNRNMLMVIINKKQYHNIIKLIHSYDQKAFVIVSDVKEVIGYGFSYDEAIKE